MEAEPEKPVAGGDSAASGRGISFSGGHQEVEGEHSQQQQHRQAGSNDSSLGRDYQHESPGEALATEQQNGPSKFSSDNNRDSHSSSAVDMAQAKEQQKKGDVTLNLDGEEVDHRKSSTRGDDGSPSCDQSAVNPPEKVEDITPELIRKMEDSYAAYVRTDVYGRRGKGHLPLKNKLSLCVALVTIVPFRLIFIALVMLMYCNYFFICKICTLYRKEGQEEGEENYGHLIGVRKKVITVMGRWLARALLFGMGFYHIKRKQGTSDVMQRLRLGLGQEERDDVEQGREGGVAAAVEGDRPCAIVSNHISYLDILYHMSSSFPSFVAKQSVSQMPLVGLLSKCMGCLYVQREGKTPNSKGVSSIVTQRLLKTRASATAQIFLLFPEGTTTNGNYILPFKTGAFLAGATVQPMILKYPYEHFNPAWDTINGYLHVIILLCQFVNHLEVTTLPPYYPSAKEREDPKAFASNVRTLMSVEGNFTKLDIGLHEKRIYHSTLAGKIRGTRT